MDFNADLIRAMTEALLAADSDGERSRRAKKLRDALDPAAQPPPELVVNNDWTKQPPPREWLVVEDGPDTEAHGWIPAGRVSMLTGTGGAGKSRLSLQLAVAIADRKNRTWIGRKGGASALRATNAEPRPVVIATWEDGRDEIARRLGAGTDRAPTLDDRLSHIDLAKRGPLWGPSAEGSGHVQTQGDWTSAGQQLLDWSAERNARALFVDPLAAGFGCEENSRPLVRTFMAHLDAWSRDNNCATILIAHPAKQTAAFEGAAYSGSTDWKAASRALLTLQYAKDPDAPKPSNKGAESPTALQLALFKSSYSRHGSLLWLSGYPTVEARTFAEAVVAEHRPTGPRHPPENDPQADWVPIE